MWHNIRLSVYAVLEPLELSSDGVGEEGEISI